MFGDMRRAPPRSIGTPASVDSMSKWAPPFIGGSSLRPSALVGGALGVEPSVLEHSDAGSGETLVLLPGGMTGWDSWLPLLPLLVADHRVINVQLRANSEGIAGRVGDPTYTTDRLGSPPTP